MPHDSPLISTIVAGLVLAFVFGAIANRFRMPPIVGYLLAGVLVGPHTPGFVADTELATELAELGVILLMFGVGLNFSLKDLISVQAVAVPGALLRIAGGTAMGTGLGLLLGWPLGGALVFGLALSVASTVVLLKTLHDRHLVDSDRGRIAVGWVIVEDVAMVLALVLIPTLTGLFGTGIAPPNDPFVNLIERMANIELGLPGVLAVTVLKLAAFVGFMFIVGRRVIPYVLHFTAHTGSRELFRLAVLAIALGVAAGSAYLFGVSLALGAFFAGMILSESELSHRAAEETLPLRDAFSVLFFVSVGMLFNPSILATNPLPVIATLFIILFGKSVISFLVIVLFGRSVSSALTISAGLAQIGEFSFILATLGVGLGIMPPEGRDLILAGAIISIILNPLMFFIAERLRPALETRAHAKAGDAETVRVEPGLTGEAMAGEPAVEEDLEPDVVHPTSLTGHAILIGYGRVGTVVADGLLDLGLPFLVIEDQEGRVAAARSRGMEVVVGNAANSESLRLANAEGASTVIVAIPNAFEAGQATERCRKANPAAIIVARAHSDEEEHHLMHLGATQVVLGEREIGMGILDIVHREGERTNEDVAEEAIAVPDEPPAPAPVLRAVTGPAAAPRIEPVFTPAAAILPAVDPEPAVEPVAPVRPALNRPAPLTGEIIPPSSSTSGRMFSDVDPPADFAARRVVEADSDHMEAFVPDLDHPLADDAFDAPGADVAVESDEDEQPPGRRPATTPASPFEE